jgi:hypothetical protein
MQSNKYWDKVYIEKVLWCDDELTENGFDFVGSQTEGKDKVIRGQLCQLRAVLPTIKLHLTMCATIANATNKYDFLDLAYPLIDRLTAIAHMGYPIRSDSQISLSIAFLFFPDS